MFDFIKFYKLGFMGKVLIVLVTQVFCSTGYAASSIIVNENFDVTAKNWTIGSQAGGDAVISRDTNKNYLNSLGSLKGSYPAASGGVYAWATYNISYLNTRDIFIDFWAKMPKAKQGFKFLKIFGGNLDGDRSNYANTTFALDYTGKDIGGLTSVSFGDGTYKSNDTAQVIDLDGGRSEFIGRSYGFASVSTPQKRNWRSSAWGTDWHHFRMRVKFNSGTTAANEVADGAYYLEIDGIVYVNATGIFNRHYSNMPIDRVELFGWAQNGTEAFEIWYDNVSITTAIPSKSPVNLTVD